MFDKRLTTKQKWLCFLFMFLGGLFCNTVPFLWLDMLQISISHGWHIFWFIVLTMVPQWFIMDYSINYFVKKNSE